MMYLKILIFAKIFLQILYFIYLLQLKEYRTDRLNEHLSRTFPNPFLRWLSICLFAPISISKLPKLTAKSVLYVVFSLIFLALTWMFPIILASMLFLSPFLVLAIHMLFFPIEKSIRCMSYNKAEQRIRELKKQNGLMVIGITGSYGKTTTKNFMNHILSEKFIVLSTERSINTPYAISNIILTKLTPQHKFLIVEMGAYRRGEIEELCTIAQPDIGIITGISNQHLALFGSQENIIKGKSELLMALPNGADAYINNETEYQPNIPKNKNLNIIAYSVKSVPIELTKTLTELSIPKYLITNIIPALLIGLKQGIDVKTIQASLKKLTSIPGRMSTSKGRGGVTLVNDSYSANEQGVMAALEELCSHPQKNKVVVMPCLIELGEEAHRIHEKIGEFLKDRRIHALITTKDYFSDIQKGARGWESVRFAPSVKQAVEDVDEFLSKDTIILIEGRVSKKIIDHLQ